MDSDDSKEMSPTAPDDEDDDVVNERKSFFQPIESPSPGSSIVGSATSNYGAFNYFFKISIILVIIIIIILVNLIGL